MILCFPTIKLKTINDLSNAYVRDVQLSHSFIAEKTNSLFLPNKARTFMSTDELITRHLNGYHLDLIFYSLNYSIKKPRRLRWFFRVSVHKSEVYICNLNLTTPIKSRIHKRRLIFFSFNEELIQQIRRIIRKFRYPDTYTGKGIYEYGDNYFIKPGKKR
jgi:hypothetical protein